MIMVVGFSEQKLLLYSCTKQTYTLFTTKAIPQFVNTNILQKIVVRCSLIVVSLFLCKQLSTNNEIKIRGVNALRVY